MEYVIGWMNVKPGQRADFIRLSRTFIHATRAEQGVLFFELLPSSEMPDVVVAIEGYASAEAHEAHLKSAHFAAFWELFQVHILDGRFENFVATSARTDVVRPG